MTQLCIFSLQDGYFIIEGGQFVDVLLLELVDSSHDWGRRLRCAIKVRYFQLLFERRGIQYIGHRLCKDILSSHVEIIASQQTQLALNTGHEVGNFIVCRNWSGTHAIIFFHLNQIYAFLNIWILNNYIYIPLMGSSNSSSAQQSSNKNQHPCLAQAQKISHRLYQVIRDIIGHMNSVNHSEIIKQINKLTYETQTQTNNLCESSLEKGFYCEDCSYIENSYICQKCFNLADHKNHKFFQCNIEKNMICICGNDQLMSSSFFCGLHNKKNGIIVVDQKIQSIFFQQMRFMIKQLFHFKEKALDENYVKDYDAFREQFIDYLLIFCGLGYEKQYLTHLLFLQFIEDQNKNSLIEKDKKKISILQKLLISFQIQEKFNILLKILVNFKAFRIQLIAIIYKHITHPNNVSDYLKKNFYNNGRFTEYLMYPKTQQQYFSKPQNCRLFLSQKSVESQYSSVFQNIYTVYQLLLKFKNGDKIIKSIIKNMSILKLCDFDDYYSLQITDINIKYYNLVHKIICILRKDHQEKYFLEQTARQSFEMIGKTSLSFSQSKERTFVLTIFALFSSQIPTKEQISHILGGSNSSSELIISLIMRCIDFKQNYAQEYRLLVIDNNSQCLAPAAVQATDHIYLRILCAMLDSEKISLLFKEFCRLKFSSINKFLPQIKQTNIQNTNQSDISKILKSSLIKSANLLTVLTEALSNNLSEKILSFDEIASSHNYILTNLLIIYDGCPAASFKSKVDQFIKDEKQIIEFIKTKATVENKKIHIKNREERYKLNLSPMSKYLQKDISDQLFDHIFNLKLENYEQNIYIKEFFSIRNMGQILQIWDHAITFVQFHGDEEKQLHHELCLGLSALTEVYLLTKEPLLRKYIDKISSILKNTSVRLRTCIYKVLEMDNPTSEKKKNQQNDKKKLKQVVLKQKQKQALNLYSNTESQSVVNGKKLECIICKSSQEESPYLLGHFRYNNFFSGNILKTSVPFLQFTSCGHTLHQKCLTDSHKGENRVWYPCILCKSISNILCPVILETLTPNQKLEKIIDFLKNFGGLYTFFFEDRKDLKQFSIEDLFAIFKLIFKSVIYQITIYPLIDPQYFCRTQFSIIKFLYSLLKFTVAALPQVDVTSQIILQGQNEFTNVYKFVRNRVEELLKGSQLMGTEALRKKNNEKVIGLLEQVFRKLETDDDLQFEGTAPSQFRDFAVGLLYRPPKDLFTLRNAHRKCSVCQIDCAKYEICVLCEWVCCEVCSDIKKLHTVQNHIIESIFIENTSGQYCYLHEDLVGQFDSLYGNYLGEIARQEDKVSKQVYTLRSDKWEKVVGDFISNRLHRQIMNFY